MQPNEWSTLFEAFPNTTCLPRLDSECRVCEESAESSQAERMKEKVKREQFFESVRRYLIADIYTFIFSLLGKTYRASTFPNSKSDPLGKILFLVPATWMDSFFRFADDSTYKLELRPSVIDTTNFICEHGKLTVNPFNASECFENKFFAVTEDEWNYLTKEFSLCGEKITVTCPMDGIFFRQWMINK